MFFSSTYSEKELPKGKLDSRIHFQFCTVHNLLTPLSVNTLACCNCQKSKRECLGYDPLFNAQLGPADIRLAPSFAPSQDPLVAAANPHGNQPQMLGAAYGAPIMSHDPALSAGVGAKGQVGYLNPTPKEGTLSVYKVIFSQVFPSCSIIHL